MDPLLSSYPLEFPLLEHPQQGDLHLWWQFGNFVQEDRATIRQLEPAQAPLGGAGEGAPLVTEKLGRDQIARNGRAVHGDKRSGGALGSPVNGSRQELFASAGLAGDENGRIAAVYLGDAGKRRRQRRRGANDLFEHRGFVDFLAERHVFLSQPLLGTLAIVDIGARDI